ncbi:MAG TPA: methyltransferase domain-containing protein [Cyclobacteriaceae bacterium]
MYERLDECPSCKSDNFHNYLICNDYLHSEESFALVKCNNCNLLFVNPRPSQSNRIKYFGNIPHKNYPYNIHLNFIEKLILEYIYKSNNLFYTNLIQNYYTNCTGTLLDIHPQTLNFLKKVTNKGWKTTYLTEGQDHLKTHHYISAVTSFDEIKKYQKFDAITIWEVFPQFYDLKSMIKKIKKRLNKEGKLFIKLPNEESYDFKNYKQNWAGLNIPRNLYLFEVNSFKKFLKKNKLKLLETVPVYTDSFVYSIISQNILDERPAFIRGLTQGYKSFKYSKKNKLLASSLVYVITK